MRTSDVYNNTVDHDLRDRVLDTLGDRIADLRMVVDAGNLTGAEHADAVAALSQLETALSAAESHGTTFAEAQIAGDAVTRADAIIAEADARYFGEGPRSVGPSDVQRTNRIEGMISDGAALRDLFESDPQAFGAQWRELSAEDRQLAMFSLQQEVAMDNQVTQMLTSLMKASHDTAMAVARNLQV